MSAGSDAVMLNAGRIVMVYGMVSVFPAVSNTSTLKVRVPSAVGVPVMTRVPVLELIVKLLAVKPVAPGTRLFSAKLVYGISPPATVTV